MMLSTHLDSRRALPPASELAEEVSDRARFEFPFESLSRVGVAVARN